MKFVTKTWINKLLDSIKYKYWSILPYDYRPNSIRYRIKCYLFKRYTTVKGRYLPHTWIDKDDILTHTAFEILSKFIEEECNPEQIVWYGEYGKKIHMNGRYRYVRDVLQELYTWWHVIYNKYYEKIQDDLADMIPEGEILKPMSYLKDKNDTRTKVFKSLNTLENFMYEEVQEKLKMLVEVRYAMWT